jgi:cobalt-zinc-cadmium resistance protein CzcA
LDGYGFKKGISSVGDSRLERALPSVKFTSGQPIIDQVMEIVTGSAADLAVSVVGDDLSLMRGKVRANC